MSATALMILSGCNSATNDDTAVIDKPDYKSRQASLTSKLSKPSDA